jgi:aminoglycoside phosphotransferase (APT) family kinase protein
MSSDGLRPPVLSAAERAVAGSILSDVWGEPVEISAAGMVWGRRHVVRLGTRDGRSVILKRVRRRRSGDEAGRDAFGIELASLEFLGGMPDPVAPRLLGADAGAGILIMEELPPGHSLAHTLLAGDRDGAMADLNSYATALGSLHAWSIGRADEFERARARYSPSADPRPWWVERIDSRRAVFLRVAAELGAATDGLDGEIDAVAAMLAGERHRSFVHGDLCPDNVRLSAGGTRIFDFEESSAGSPALDAAYLLAPFPSCWCFASVPETISAQAMNAYLAALTAGGVEAADDLQLELAAALAGWVAARGNMIERALKRDEEWGTTTMRPRLVAWTERLAAVAAATGAFPRLRAIAERLNDRFLSLWPDAIVPAYPALAEPQHGPLAEVPGWWEPDT